MAGLAPQVIVNVKDETATNVGTIKTPLPLDKPFYALITQKGKEGLEYYYNYADAVKEFGAETFNENNTTYFTRAAMFAKATFENNGCWLMRLVPDDAEKSNIVFYVTIKEGDVPQWQKAADGSRSLNPSGDWIPVMVGEEQATLPGYYIYWTVEPLTEAQTFNTLTKTTTVIADDGTYIKFPILALQHKSGCLSGDNIGLEMYYSEAQNTVDKLEILKNLRFTIKIKEKEFSSSTVNYIRDAFDAVENSFTLAPDIIDTQLSMNVGINDILQTRYYDNNLISFDYHAYNDNFVELCQILAATLTTAEADSFGDLYDLDNSGLINVMSLINPFTGFEYDTIAIDPIHASANMIPNITHFLQGGSDGNISIENEFAMLKDVYSLNTYPDLRDHARYPMTVIYDVGYSMSVKHAMLDFLTIREDVVAILGTYQYADDLGQPMAELNMAEDLAVGQALYSRALLMRESALFGTPATRVGIFCQSGVPNNSVKNTVVPAGTFWWASKFSERFNRTYIYSKMSPAPNNINDLFVKLNWTPSSVATQTALWNNGLNYCQYYDDVQLFYAGLRSVYPYDTSTLLDLEFVFMICFVKQIARKVWAQRTGSDEQSDTRFYNTKVLASNLVSTMLNGRSGSTVSVYQTVDEATAGYIDHIQIGLQKAKATTVHYVDVVAQKSTAI